MSNYDASNIELLSGLEGVRKRPAMYIGSTNSMGLHHLVWEIVDNAVDEALNGFGNKITVTLHKDGSVSVQDEGRGIPCDVHKQTKVPAIQLIFPLFIVVENLTIQLINLQLAYMALVAVLQTL